MKGRSIAKYYTVPSHRYSCDLDVFIGSEWGRACELLEGQGIRLEHEVYKEVEFTLDNVYVECHRYITPVRGNKHLKEFERYLRSLLDGEPKEYFEGTTLVCPPLMFTVMLYIEHALGDLLGKKAPINSYKLEKMTKSLTFCNDKARRELGWEPLDVLTNYEI